MNKKIAGLILGAVLTTGIGGFGTYAYFTDNANVDQEIEVVFGTLDVEADWAKDGFNKWTPESAQNEAKTEDGKFTNVKPGDKFHRDITVKNVGSLKADTSIELNEMFRSDAFDIVMAVQKKGSDKVTYHKPGVADRFTEHAVAPGAEYTVRISVEVNKELKNEWQGTGAKEVQNFIKVGAHQVIY